MIKNIKHLFLLIAFFCTGMLMHAQTTDLLYHLGGTGSSNSINVASVATDASGNIFVCGSATGSNIEFNPLGTTTLRNAGTGGSGFIAKYNSNGILQAVILFGANAFNKGVKVYVDPAKQNVYLLASIYNNGVKLDPLATGFGTNGLAGSMAIAKYDNALVFKSQKIFNNGIGNTGDVLNDLAFYGADLYVTGTLFTTAIVSPPNPGVEFNPGGASKILSSNGISDVFVAKYDTTTLTNQWVYNIGAGNADGGNGIDLDNSGNIYLTGYFTGQNIDLDPTAATKTLSEVGGGSSTGDAFVAKYNGAMVCQWAFNIGAAQVDKGNDILVDKTVGNVYVGGIVKNDALDVYFDPTTTVTANFSGVGLNDIFIASYSSSGNYNWHLATGSSGEDELSTLSFDSGGNIVLSGFASGNVNFGNSKTITGLGSKDGYFAVISSTSGLATAAYNLGGASDEQANSVTVDPSGRILVVGSYIGAGDYNLGNATTISPTGIQDGFISRHVLCTPPSITTQPSGTTKCEGTAVSFTVVASGATSYQWKKAGTTISGATNATYSIAAVTTGQAGNYTVEVTNACQTVASSNVALIVNPKPAVTSAATAAVCSASAVGYSITSDVAATYSWTRAAQTGITPTLGSGSTASIAEVLTNSTTAPIDVDYIIIPTATTGSCLGESFTLTVKVNPKPAITSVNTASVCTGIALNYIIASNVASGYNWTRANKAGITPSTGLGSASPITETLSNSTVSPINVDYIITPTAITGGCTGTPFTLTVTVNPSVTPTVTATSSATTICAGGSITLTSNSTNAGTPTYKWKLGSAYISGATNATYTTTGATNGDVYSVEMTSSLACASPATVTSTGVAITVTPSVTPTVTATSSATTICAGSNITFTANSTNAGTPAYKWKLGSAYISGATNATYTTNGATNGDVYSVEMTSTASCASPATVTSTGVAITVSPSVTPTVTATSSATTICAGGSITLTANTTNGGTPTYKWKLGSAYISGATNATYTTTGAANGDVYSVEMTSSLACVLPATLTSTGVAITVTPSVTPTITATSSATTICTGTSITLTANTTNGGTPTYKWKLGSAYISGATNATYTTTGATNGDVYSVEMTSTASCASPATVTSTGVSITVTPSVTPTVTATSSATTICAGGSITLTANTTNGGTPTYKWKLGSAYISGATNATYTTTGATNGDVYSVEMTSSLACASPATVTSASVVITVNPVLVPTVAISTASSAICTGDVITFTLTPINPGSTPSYVWRKNGVAITPAATGTSYSTTSAANGDIYSVVLTSNALCASPTSVPSNNITVTVNPLPTITGAGSVCVGSTTSLTGSGTANVSNPWISSAPAVATISNAGLVTGIASGTTTITYTNNNGCSETTILTVNPAPTVIGTLSVCVGATTQLTGSGTGSASPWLSATPAVATINNTGLVTGVAAGTSIITYTTNTGCSKTVTVTVNALPTITGTAAVCAGFTTQLTGSGTAAALSPWLSASTSVATISNSGLVTGLSAGTSVVTYTNSNGCVTSQTITVNPVATPGVSIAANNSTICAGTSITFTATPTDGGVNPTYKWKSGSSYISGATNATYTTTTAVNGDSYSVEMTSNALCASTSIATSNPIVISVTTSVTPTVVVSANPGSSICAGTSVTFTATPGNGGTSPTYQWKKNGIAISAATNATYTNAALINGDQISVDMISNSSCASTPNASSPSITMAVISKVTPTVSVAASATNICAGTGVTFTATYTNEGTTPLFEWFVNSVSQGTPDASDTYTSATLTNGSQVSVKMTSSITCVTIATVTSTNVTITVTPTVTPTVSIISDKTTICAGGSVIYTATPVNGGTASYQWKVNGTNSGSASASNTFTTSSLGDGDKISVELTSSVTCVTSTTATSNELVITVAPATQIITQPGDQSVCALGNNVIFSVGANGDALTYQWKTGSTNLANNSTYSGVTTKDLIISNVSNADLLGYQVTVTGTCGTLTSNVATLTQSTSAINIVTQPVPQVLETGEMIQLSVTATGPTLSYQWKKNGVDLVNDSRISGANTASLQISNALLSDSDNNYTCLIMSPCAAQVTSNAASVTVTTATSTQDALAKGFIIAPNPSAGHFTLSNNYAPFLVEELEIISMDGMVVARKTIIGTTNLSEEVYAEDLPKGMYLLVIKGRGEQALLKILFDK